MTATPTEVSIYHKPVTRAPAEFVYQVTWTVGMPLIYLQDEKMSSRSLGGFRANMMPVLQCSVMSCFSLSSVYQAPPLLGCQGFISRFQEEVTAKIKEMLMNLH